MRSECSSGNWNFGIFMGEKGGQAGRPHDQSITIIRMERFVTGNVDGALIAFGCNNHACNIMDTHIDQRAVCPKQGRETMLVFHISE
ncbi:hypothetical protein PoB_002164400 [Plakobranchus ocellatus]|uniref:Uncharacterized protein n=1 Tax=Plakobranchus ocellatus TaxID=259542 RepID=A0AAV3ZMN7_9GAST|nr:hypothetical protein PoB_002164400 [Plakobranchus ocellatus]